MNELALLRGGGKGKCVGKGHTKISMRHHRFHRLSAVLLVDSIKPRLPPRLILRSRLPILPTAKPPISNHQSRPTDGNDTLPRTRVVLILLSLNSTDCENRPLRLTYSDDRNAFNKCFSKSTDKCLAGFRRRVLGFLKEVGVEVCGEFGLAASC